VDSADGMATLEAMSSHHNFRPGQQNKLVSEPPIAAPDEHAQFVEADQRFRAALGQAIAAGGERIEAVEATVQLERRTKLPRCAPLRGSHSGISVRDIAFLSKYFCIRAFTQHSICPQHGVCMSRKWAGVFILTYGQEKSPDETL